MNQLLWMALGAALALLPSALLVTVLLFAAWRRERQYRRDAVRKLLREIRSEFTGHHRVRWDPTTTPEHWTRW